MTKDAKRGYDRVALHQRIPEDRAEIFLGYVPGIAEVRAMPVLEQRERRKAAILSRTAWKTGGDTQLVVEVSETTDADAAISALLERLSFNQLARVPEGPVGLGLVSFAHPAGVAPAVFFVRGNLEIAVTAVDEKEDAAAVAGAIDRLLSAASPPGVEPIEVEADTELALPEGEGRDRDVFLRIDVAGARARLDDEHRKIRILGGRGQLRAARIGRSEKQSGGVILR